jgi:hypothetical protein
VLSYYLQSWSSYCIAWREHEHRPYDLRRLPTRRHRRPSEYAPPGIAERPWLTSGIVRTTRARIIRLKNDYKDLMSRIEKGLHAHHARMAEQAQNNPGAASQAQAALSPAPAPIEAPFARVNSVVADSPAESAGLRVGDTITKFGWVDWTNHERLARVAEAVSQNEGVSASWQMSCLVLTAHSFPSQSRRCDRAPPAAQQRQSRCSSHHGRTGAGAACWAVTCCRCSHF